MRFGPGRPAGPGARVPKQPTILTVAVGPPAAAGRRRRAAISRLRRLKSVTRNERPVNDPQPNRAAARLRHIEPASFRCPAGEGRAGGGSDAEAEAERHGPGGARRRGLLVAWRV